MGFNKELSKKSTLETFNDDSPVDSQGIEIKSPGKMYWFSIKGKTIDDLIEVTTTKLFDPDGEQQEYLIQVEDPGLREKVFNKADDNINVKLQTLLDLWVSISLAMRVLTRKNYISVHPLVCLLSIT